MDDAPAPSSRTLTRGLAVLEIVAGSTGGIGVSEIASRVDFDKGTVSRLLATLRRLGYVNQRSDRLFEIGSKAAWLAGSYDNRLDLIRRAAAPHLAELCARTRETVHLAVREGAFVVYIAQEQPDRELRVDSAVGRRLPLHHTAMGRAFLAALEPAERAALLAGLPAEPSFEAVDERGLEHDVTAAARRGWAAIDRDDEVTRLAALVSRGEGQAVAALALSGPSYRVDPHLDELGALVVETAGRIGSALDAP